MAAWRKNGSAQAQRSRGLIADSGQIDPGRPPRGNDHIVRYDRDEGEARWVDANTAPASGFGTSTLSGISAGGDRVLYDTTFHQVLGGITTTAPVWEDCTLRLRFSAIGEFRDGFE